LKSLSRRAARQAFSAFETARELASTTSLGTAEAWA